MFSYHALGETYEFDTAEELFDDVAESLYEANWEGIPHIMDRNIQIVDDTGECYIGESGLFDFMDNHNLLNVPNDI